MTAKKKKKKEQGGNPQMSAAIDSMSAIYNKAKDTAKSFSGEKVPEGRYEACLSSTKLKEAAKEGVPRLTWIRTWTILSGDNEGMTQTDFMTLTNEVGLSYAMQSVSSLGYGIPEEPSDWPDVIEALQEEAPVCTVEMVHAIGSDFVNVSVLEVLDGDEGDDEELDEDELREKLEEMDRRELKAFRTHEELDIKVTRKMEDSDIVDAIIEASFDDE